MLSNSLKEIKKSVVILDTCILQYLNNKLIRDDIFKLLKAVEENKNILRVSDFSTYELFSECKPEREKQLSEIWEMFPRYQVVPKVTRTAAHLSTFYRYEENTKGLTISDGDKIVGATAYLTNSYVFTADLNDFPRPFFVEKFRKTIRYKDKEREKMIALYILRADYSVFSHKFKENEN